MRNIYLIILLTIFLLDCSSAVNIPSPAEPSTKVSVWKNQNQLWVNTASGKKQLLAEDGQDYDTTISADGRWLVVDVVLFSNLQITRLLERNMTGNYTQVRNLSQEAWQLVCKQLAIDIDDLINPRTRFVSWSNDDKSVTLEASAYTSDDEDIFETVTITLGSENL